MWTLLGSWVFILLVVVMAGVGLFVAVRRRRKAVLAAATGAFVVATVALVSLLVSPATVDSGVECGTTIGSTKTQALGQMTAEDLAAAGEEDYTDDCRDAARQRYGLAVVGYLITLAAVGGASAVRGKASMSSETPRSRV